MSGTHTYAELAVSPGTYREIEQLLRDAGYDHVFIEDPDEGTAIDMQGIGLVQETLTQDERLVRDRRLGRSAYDLYAEAVAWKLYDGDDLPAWDDLPESIRCAWIATALGMTGR